MFQDVNFTTRIADVYDANGRRIPKDIGRGVYREDTGELMSICGPSFKPVQHMDVLQPVLDGLADQGYAIEERHSASRGALYDLQGKKGAWVSPKVTDNGAVMRVDIILGDFIQPTGASNYLDDGPDTNFFRISLLNSHNSKFDVRANTSYLRLVCMNGMPQPHFSANAYGKHTSGFNIDGLQRQIGNAMSMMGEDADKFGLMARTPVTVEQATEFLKLTLAKLPNKATGEAHFSEPLLNKILGQFAREDQTLWGLYNAVTWWQTHDDFRKNADRLTATIGREQKVASMLRSKHMEEVFAI